MAKNVLITGAGGFIGSNLVKYLLLNTDWNITGIDNLIGGVKNYNKILIPEKGVRFRFIKDNLKYIDSYSNLENIDTVFHLAATPRVSYSVEHPLETNENNVSNTLILMEWCRKIGVKRFIFSSSSSVYGDTEILPTSEDVSLRPKSPYALQKRTIEEYCRLYSELYGLDTAVLRYFNVYGPGQYAENAYATVISAWIKGIYEDEKIRLDGNGEQSRDFTYVDDVCAVNLMMAKTENNFNGAIYNVGDNYSVSLNDILYQLKNLTCITPEIDYRPTRAGDVFKTQADNKKISNLGFKCKVNIETGLVNTLDWYLKETNRK